MSTEVQRYCVIEPQTQTNESSNGGEHLMATTLKKNKKQKKTADVSQVINLLLRAQVSIGKPLME